VLAVAQDAVVHKKIERMLDVRVGVPSAQELTTLITTAPYRLSCTPFLNLYTLSKPCSCSLPQRLLFQLVPPPPRLSHHPLRWRRRGDPQRLSRRRCRAPFRA